MQNTTNSFCPTQLIPELTSGINLYAAMLSCCYAVMLSCCYAVMLPSCYAHLLPNFHTFLPINQISLRKPKAIAR